MMSSLTVELRFDDIPSDDDCHMTFIVEHDGFAGTSSAWTNEAEIDRFVIAAGSFPLPSTSPTTLNAGVASEVLLVVSQRDDAGHLRARVVCAQRSSDSPKRIELVLPTTYQQLTDFCAELRLAIEKRRGGRATLQGG